MREGALLLLDLLFTAPPPRAHVPTTHTHTHTHTHTSKKAAKAGAGVGVGVSVLTSPPPMTPTNGDGGSTSPGKMLLEMNGHTHTHTQQAPNNGAVTRRRASMGDEKDLDTHTHTQKQGKKDKDKDKNRRKSMSALEPVREEEEGEGEEEAKMDHESGAAAGASSSTTNMEVVTIDDDEEEEEDQEGHTHTHTEEQEELQETAWVWQALPHPHAEALTTFSFALQARKSVLLLDSNNALGCVCDALRETKKGLPYLASLLLDAAVRMLSVKIQTHTHTHTYTRTAAGLLVVEMVLGADLVGTKAVLASVGGLVGAATAITSSSLGEEEKEKEQRHALRALLLQQLTRVSPSSSSSSPLVEAEAVPFLLHLLDSEVGTHTHTHTLPAQASVVSFFAGEGKREWSMSHLRAADRLCVWERLFRALGQEGGEEGEGKEEGGKKKKGNQSNNNNNNKAAPSSSPSFFPLDILRSAAAHILSGPELIEQLKSLLLPPSSSSSNNKKGGHTHTNTNTHTLTQHHHQAVAALELIQQARAEEEVLAAAGKEEMMKVEEEEETEEEERVGSTPWSLLLPSLVGLLSESTTVDGEAHTHPPTHDDADGREYLQLLALETLCDIVIANTHTPTPTPTPIQTLTIHPILTLLETSPSLHVRNAAIKLLARLSAASPTIRQASLSRILAWLGKETLQQPDPYSFSLVLRVLESVVPAACGTHTHTNTHTHSKKGQQKTPPSSSSMIEIAQVFVHAHTHILPSRRPQLYHTLIRTLGEHGLGPVQLLLLLEHHRPKHEAQGENTHTHTHTHTQSEGTGTDRQTDTHTDTDTQAFVEFLDSLAGKLSPVQQVLSLADLVEMARLVLGHLLKCVGVNVGGGEEGEGEGEGEGEKSGLSFTLRSRREAQQPQEGGEATASSTNDMHIDLSPILTHPPTHPHPPTPTEHITWYSSVLLSLFHLLLKSLQRRASLGADSDQAQASQRGYLLLIEEILHFLRLTTTATHTHIHPQATTNKQTKRRRKALLKLLEALHRQGGCVLDNLHSLLSVPSFVAIIARVDSA